jgi:hypothetical protein
MEFEQEKLTAIVLVLILVIVAVLFVYLPDKYFIRGMELVRVLSWPIVVLIAGIFFKKVFTYLFFSLDEFNFFGARGKLKEVKEVIREKAAELRNQERREEEEKIKIETLTNKLQGLQTSKQEKQKIIHDLLRFSNDLFRDYKKISEEKRKLEAKLEKLQKDNTGTDFSFLRKIIEENKKGKV